jgi:hypothetical protein
MTIHMSKHRLGEHDKFLHLSLHRFLGDKRTLSRPNQLKRTRPRMR